MIRKQPGLAAGTVRSHEMADRPVIPLLTRDEARALAGAQDVPQGSLEQAQAKLRCHLAFQDTGQITVMPGQIWEDARDSTRWFVITGLYENAGEQRAWVLRVEKGSAAPIPKARVSSIRLDRFNPWPVAAYLLVRAA